MSTEMELAFPTLTTRQIAELKERGTVRQVKVKDVLFGEGDRDFGFFVVLSSAVEVLQRSNGVERAVTVHRAGAFTGDVDLLSGRAAIVTGRVCEAGEVLALEGTRALERATLRSLDGEPDLAIAARGLFIFIGAVPHTRWLGTCVALDDKGFVITGPALSGAARASDAWVQANRDPFFLETSLPGVFAAGDAPAAR